MQNKGFVRVIATALILVSAFYLSFSFVTRHYSDKATEFATSTDGTIDQSKYFYFIDSIATEEVWFGYTLKECREKEINLGLDLKGGMNVVLEISVQDIVKALSGDSKSETFNKALALAAQKQKDSDADYLTLFEQSFKEIDPNAQLASVFYNFELKEKIQPTSTNAEVMEVLRTEVAAAVSNSFNVLRTRIDRFGVVQPNIQELENTGRILIELPGVKEPERVRKLLQGSANLEFFVAYNVAEIQPSILAVNNYWRDVNAAGGKKDTAAATTAAADTTKKANGLKQLIAQKADSPKASKAETDANPLFSILKPAGGGPTVGVAHYSDTAKVNKLLKDNAVKSLLPRDLHLKWGVKGNDDGEFVLYAIKSRDGKAPLEGDVIVDAKADFAQNSSQSVVSMQMNADGSAIWARLTKENIGNSIAIVLDGYVYSAPTVNSEIPGGRSEISGGFTVEEAKDLANVLKSGKMPAPARIVQEDVVGPSLGKEAIESGLFSFIIAFVLVLLWMLFYYGLVPGLVADLALFLNVFLLLGILASFKAVLTLPGIAGIVLTLGMAVDTNVLIYERIREELRSGKGIKKALEDGYNGASSAIIDANLTTLITGIILAIVGTGPIKGFAITLVIGIITSFITGFILSRLFFTTLSEKDKLDKVPFSNKITENWFTKTKFKIVEKRKVAYFISGALLLVSIISLSTRGLNQGVDFSGGRNYVIRFENLDKVDVQTVRSALKGAFGDATLNVIAIGDPNQVRITTNYKITDNADNVDDEIETILFKGLKPMLPANATEDSFVTTNIMSSQKVGPTIADDIKSAAFFAFFLAIIGIGLYILIRFRNLAFSVGAVASLMHDALIVLGLFSLLYSIMPFTLEIDQAFIAAILTVIGYSVNDTVIIFDRVREYLHLYPKRNKVNVLNDSMNSTLGRTFNTSFTTIIVLIAIFLFGGEVIRGFIFALLVGIVVGTYSSLFVAVPVAFEVLKKRKTKGYEAENTTEDLIEE